MTSLSQFLRGGNTYTPAMMEFNGSSYYSGTYTSTGNKVTVVCRFNVPSYADGTSDYIFRAIEDTNERMTIIATASNHGTADYAGRIRFLVENSSNVTICELITPLGYLTGNTHTLFAAFDGDLGLATYIIDGQNVDDTTNGTRTAPTTGTLDTGASSNIGVAASSSGAGTLVANSNVGFCGMIDDYLTNWQDFMHDDGSPKEIDTSGWSQFGGTQPEFWNPHGDMANNLGSESNLTVNDTIVVGDGGNGPHSHFGLRTDGTATAASIRTGETAWVNGLEITGNYEKTDNMTDNTLVFWDCTQYSGTTAFTPTEDEMYLASGVTIDSQTTAGNNIRPEGSTGVVYVNSHSLLWDLPAKPAGSVRVYKCGFQSTADSWVQFAQIRILTNYQDGNDFMSHRVMANGASNTWIAQMLELISGGENGRDGPDSFSSSNFPNDGTQFELTVIDAGDLIGFTCTGINIDTNTSTSYYDTKNLEYYTSSRPGASTEVAGLRFEVGNTLTLKYFHAYDTLDDD